MRPVGSLEIRKSLFLIVGGIKAQIGSANYHDITEVLNYGSKSYGLH